MFTVDASLGPALVRVIVYVMFEPAATGSGVSLFVIARSALVPTVVVVVALLFAAFGSPVVEVTFAVFVMTVRFGVPAPTFTTIVKTSLADAATEAFVAITVPVAQIAGVVKV